jgi:hypothetical protein
MSNHELTQNCRNIGSSKTVVYIQAMALAREHIDHRQHPDLSAMR